MRPLPAGALLALALAGCATESASPRARSPLPAEELGPGAAPIASSVAAEPVAIDLATVLALAGEKPNAIRFAREKVAEAEAQTLASTSGLLPSLSLGGDFQRHNGTIQDVSGPFIETTRQAVFLGGTGELVLDVGGGVLALLRDRQRREAASADLESAEQERASSAAAAYFTLVGARASVGVARDGLEHALGFLGIASSRERNNVGLPLDTIRAQADVARGRQELIAAEEHARIASIRLATILRLDATVSLAPAERELRPITFVAPETPVEGLIATALESHPDIHAAARRVAAADLEDDAARYGPFIPSLHAGVGGLNGGLGYDGPTFGKLSDREDYYVGLELRLTGLGLGEIARARASGARLRAEKVRADDVRETVIRLVLEARETVRSRSAAIEVARDELRAAEEARGIARKRLEQGTGIAIDVLAAEEERTRAATHVIDAITGYNAAQYELLSRLGERPRP
jgi:outer membrane protein TolC